MIDQSINKLNSIQDNINKLEISNSKEVNIICVSKTFSMDKIKPLIDHGHLHFGENKVQEADLKWKEIKKNKPEINLHMVGRLQSNKSKKAVEVFDFIHSLDSIKLANLLKKSEDEQQKKLSYFIQVNIGQESQKSGIPAKDTKDFLKYCLSEINLNVVGLMVLPPDDDNSEKYFSEISKLNSDLGLKHLSMGMSQDYKIALKYNSTFLRIGSAIFGPRV
tara:strand:+ start:2401 stop:3060 length:660 start_codon:yes stop_codon:yes gene_type:complete